MVAEKADFVCPPHLPPRDAWKVNPDTLKKFYAPTDDRGFVLLDETVQEVKSLFDDNYEWPIDPRYQQTQPDSHHFHWVAERYKPTHYRGRTVPQRFRELPTVRGILPRQFHNVIHKVTLPPHQPKYREMRNHLEAYNIARRLFETASRASQLQADITSSIVVADSGDKIANEMLIHRFDKQFHNYRRTLEELLGAVGLEALHLDDPKFQKRKPREVARLLSCAVRFTEVTYVPLFKNAA